MWYVVKNRLSFFCEFYKKLTLFSDFFEKYHGEIYEIGQKNI